MLSFVISGLIILLFVFSRRKTNKLVHLNLYRFMQLFDQITFPIIITALLIISLLIALITIKYKEYQKKRKQKKRFERGNILETQAKSFLEKKGYRILEAQKQFYHNYEVNGKHRSSKLIVDYIAKKNGKTYIVEVKSGNSAISLNDKNSRRQLLEYDFVIENDGVILLDMENKNIQFVKFHTKVAKKNLLFQKLIIITGLLILLPFWPIKIIASLILVTFWFYPFLSKKHF